MKTIFAFLSGLFLSACTQAMYATVNTPAKIFGSYDKYSDILYHGSSNEHAYKLDYYKAKPDESRGNASKMIFFIYGGAWKDGDKSDYEFIADFFTKNGFDVAIPNYRKYPEVTFPKFVEDSALAAKWLSENFNAYNPDIKDIVVVGHSAGAHTGALLISDKKYFDKLGVNREMFSKFVGLAGPYGFSPEKDKYKKIFGYKDDYSFMQPLNFADGKEPEVLLLHGAVDDIVEPLNSKKYAKKVNDLGGDAELKIYNNLDHIDIVSGLSRIAPNSYLQKDIINFLNQ